MYLNSASSGKTSAYKMKWQISELYQLSKSKKLSLSIQHKQRKLIKEQTESDPRGLSGSYPEVFLKAKSQKLDISWSGANNQQITINNPLHQSNFFVAIAFFDYLDGLFVFFSYREPPREYGLHVPLYDDTYTYTVLSEITTTPRYLKVHRVFDNFYCHAMPLHHVMMIKTEQQ